MKTTCTFFDLVAGSAQPKTDFSNHMIGLARKQHNNNKLKRRYYEKT